MNITLLGEILIIFGLAIAVLLLCWRVRVPTLVGLLLTGVLAGPHGLGWISAVEDVDFLAEVGVALLLFNIGLQVSLKKFIEAYRLVLVGGFLQVALTLVIGACCAALTGRSFGEATLLGFLFSLSSTALVLKLLQDRSELGTPHGRLTLSILIFQDIIVMPMLLAVPFLAKELPIPDILFWNRLIVGVLLLFAVFIGGQFFVPRLLAMVAKTRSNELFALSVLFICFSIAWVTFQIGLSLAVGAFLSGLTISRSEYHHKALGRILPLQEVFTSFFFVSTGMFLNVTIFLAHPLTIALVVLGTLAIKSGVVTVIALGFGLSLGSAIMAGFALCQMGEFSFVLLKSAIHHGLTGGVEDQILFAVILIGMAVTPFAVALAPRVARWLSLLPLSPTTKRALGLAISKADLQRLQEGLRDHAVVVGFGALGRNLARCLQQRDIPFIVVDSNPEVVRKYKDPSLPIVLGDATSEAVLSHVFIAEARVLAVVVDDLFSACQVVELARQRNPDLHIVVRSRRLNDVEELMRAGASEIIPDEVESSIKILRRVMRRYHLSREEIETLIADIHAADYRRLHRLAEVGEEELSNSEELD